MMKNKIVSFEVDQKPVTELFFLLFFYTKNGWIAIISNTYLMIVRCGNGNYNQSLIIELI